MVTETNTKVMTKEFLQELVEQALPGYNYLIEGSEKVISMEVHLGFGQLVKIDFTDTMIMPLRIKAPRQHVIVPVELMNDKEFLIKLLVSMTSWLSKVPSFLLKGHYPKMK